MCFILLKYIGDLMHQEVLIFKNCTFCPHCIQMFVFISEQKAIFVIYNINGLVQTASLNKTPPYTLSLKG
jgi:hypothetical protein